MRKVSAEGETGFWMASNRDGADLCVWLGSYTWTFNGLKQNDLGRFNRYADADFRCGNDFHWEGRGEARAQRDDCRAADDISSVLADMRQTLLAIVAKEPGPTLVAAGDTPLSGISVPGTRGHSSALIMPKPVYFGPSPKQTSIRVCANLVLQLFDLSFGAAFTPSCDNTIPRVDEMTTLLVQIPPNTPHWIAASPTNGRFGFGLPIPANSLRGSTGPVHPILWGDLDQHYVGDWLVAVWKSTIGNQTESPVPTVDDPLPSSDVKTPVGLTSKWMVAGMRRTMETNGDYELVALSKAARDWMARTLVSNPDRFAGTLLRQEKARPDLGRQ